MAILLRPPNPAEEQRIPDKAQDPIGRTRAKNSKPIHDLIVSVLLLRDKLIGLPAWRWITGLDGTAAALEVAGTIVRQSARRSPFRSSPFAGPAFCSLLLVSKTRILLHD